MLPQQLISMFLRRKMLRNAMQRMVKLQRLLNDQMLGWLMCVKLKLLHNIIIRVSCLHSVQMQLKYLVCDKYDYMSKLNNIDCYKRLYELVQLTNYLPV